MKDHMARAMIECAAADGRLSPRGTVVEYTAGTTGISLAFVCAALGYRTHFVFSDAFSDEKRYTMRAYGAQITRSEEHTSELQSHSDLVCRLLLEKKKKKK